MLKVIIMVIAFSGGVSSKELIAKFDELEKINSLISEGKIFRVKKWGGLKKVRDIGKVISPYYIKNGITYGEFKENNICYRIRVNLNKKHFAKKFNCRFRSRKFNYKDHKAYYLKKQNDLDLETQINLGVEKHSVEIDGIKTPYRLVHEIKEPNVQKVQLSISLRRSLSFYNKRLKLVSVLENTATEFAYLSEKKEYTRNIIDLKEMYGDFVLQNRDDNIIILKRFQPRPLNFKLLIVNSKILKMFDRIESFLLPFKGEKYCFLDDLIEPTKSDCHKVGFKNYSASWWKSFYGIFVDVNNLEIEIL